jgi:hypothetical protein
MSLEQKLKEKKIALVTCHFMQKQIRKPVAQKHVKEPAENTGKTLADNRPESYMQLKRLSQNQKEHVVVQAKKDQNGLPEKLKTSIEQLSGISMDGVQVHYHSQQPARLNADAFAQGNDIHLGAGQEKHLAHEAWHVVQQKQGRVKPTAQLHGNININDDKHLENEADLMGSKANDFSASKTILSSQTSSNNSQKIIQGAWWYSNNQYAQLSQNPEPDDVTQDEAVHYVNTHYGVRVIEIDVPFSVQEMTVENGWVKLPIRKARQQLVDFAINRTRRGLQQTSHSSAAETETETQGHGLEEPDALMDAEEARTQLKDILKMMAAIFLPAYIAWETYRASSGRHAGGGTGHVSKDLMQQLNNLFDSCHHTIDSLNKAYDVQNRPILHGFLWGIHPAPMPIAEEYASLNDLARGFRQIRFLLLANQAEFQILKEGILGKGIVPDFTDEHHDVHAGASSSTDEAESMVSKRNKGMGGFAMGAATSFGAFNILARFGFDHPFMVLQPFWDSFHVLNEYSVHAAKLRKIEMDAYYRTMQQLQAMEENRRRVLAEIDRMQRNMEHVQGRPNNIPVPDIFNPILPQHPPIEVPLLPINRAQLRMEQLGVAAQRRLIRNALLTARKLIFKF